MNDMINANGTAPSKAEEVKERLLNSFQTYYNVNREKEDPFDATAEFHSHGEQFFFFKVAKYADIDSNEYVYVSTMDALTPEAVTELSKTAWERGIAKVHPGEGHKNSDVSLYLICNSISEEAEKLVKKTKYSKSYMFTFYGWSNFRLVALDLSTQKCVSNRLGSDLKKNLQAAAVPQNK